MIFRNRLFLWFISLARLIVAVNVNNTQESCVREFLRSLNEKSAESASKLVNAQWQFETNNTENAKKELFQLTSVTIKNAKLRFENVVKNYSWKSYSDPDVQRQLKLYSEVGTLALSDEEYQRFQKIMSDLEIIQQNTTICDYYNKTKCDLHLYPDVQERLETSQNPGELSYLWAEWRKVTEPEFRKLLEGYVELCNRTAVANNYANFRDYTLRNIEVENIKQKMESLWEGLKPLYQQIHAYVRRKLRDIYGEKVVPSKGFIPAHLLGNIWSENWAGIAHRVIPFPEHDNLNFTEAFINQGYTPETMHKLAEDFFASMNFSIPPHLWFSEVPEITKNLERCHPKIFNFYADGVRIKDCPKVSLKNYLEDIRLLTKAEYMLQYNHQPFIYQTPADPGLEEAVNNIMTMSASTFANLKKLGLVKDDPTEEMRLNRLFKLALEKITSVSFLLVQELLRWNIYNGKTIENSMIALNGLREKFQGISTFTKELTFDPGGMGSVFSKLSLAHNFLGHFLEFQIYDSLCHTPMESEFSDCNLFGNLEGGLALRNMMSLGSSKPLSEILSSVFGYNDVDHKSILKYFEPLTNWLTKENERTGEFIGWEEEERLGEIHPQRRRRKRSLEDYQAESKEDDTDNTPSREPDRFQRLINKRSKNNVDESEFERKRKSAGNDESIEKKAKNSLAYEQKQRRNAEEAARRSFYLKKRRSLTKSNQNAKENSNELTAGDENGSGGSQKYSKFASRNSRNSGYEYLDQSFQKPKLYPRNAFGAGESAYQKRSDIEMSRNFDSPTSGNSPSSNNAGSANSNNMRFARRSHKSQRQFDKEAITAEKHHIWRREENYPDQGGSPSRSTQWHTDTKKDISRLLHSFGFAMENDDKDKIKELKKKLKGDSNSDLKSNIASKEGSFESMMDYSRMKSAEGRGDPVEDKGTNNLWSMKSYLTDGAKILQSNSGLDKKESLSNAHLPNSMIAHVSEEKNIGKKETSSNSQPSLTQGKERLSEGSEAHLMQSSDSGVRHINIDVPSLQALLQKADLNSYGQKIFTVTPEMTENKLRSDMNQMYATKPASNKFSNSYVYKYSPGADTMPQYKEKKEYREDFDTGSKSPYIIILGQVTPDMKEKLMQEKGATILEADKQQFQGPSNLEEKKLSDKRGRASEQIYIVPIDLKNGQHNLMKPNHYAEHEHEAGHDPNTERDQESEEEQLHLEDNPKLDDKSNFYKTGKENPSEFIISWNNDKNRKIVKRSKREHKKEFGEDKLKLVKIAPMKESFLEGLLGKSLDHANLDDKNVKILIHDGLLNGNADMQSGMATSSSSLGSPVALTGPGMDQSQTSSLQSSPLSSLASSVLSALSPKSFSQVAKAANQHQDSDLEEENLKDNPNAQALGKKKGAKLYSDDDTKKLIDVDPAARGDDACCKKIILTPCPPKCPCPCPGPCSCPCPLPCPLPCPCPCPGPCPCPCPCPCPDDCCKRIIECPPLCCRPECDLCCKRPSECSLVNCQFKITKAKKPHERLTIMIYDRINPPAELPEPYDALAVISEILQRIQCCSCKPCCQLTEEDPDYPANDNTDQLKGNPNQPQENKAKIQELSGEIPILGGDSPEEDETDDNAQNLQNSQSSSDEDKYQPKEKATPAIDQLTVFNKDKLKPVFIELRKIDDIIRKRSHQK